MLEVKFNTVEEINEQLKSQLGKLLFKGYSENTDKEIENVFKEVEKFAEPQSLILEDIQFFEHDLKIEYQCQNRHYTMILGCSK
jgi:FKBP-type peptidyl-prolyl cis-trans isomerase (trigger factor)